MIFGEFETKESYRLKYFDIWPLYTRSVLAYLVKLIALTEPLGDAISGLLSFPSFKIFNFLGQDKWFESSFTASLILLDCTKQ